MKGIFDRYLLTDDFRYEIKKASISETTSNLEMEIELNFIVPFKDLDEIKKGLIKEIPGVRGVVFDFLFVDIVMTEDEIIEAYIPYMCQACENNNYGLLKTIKTSNFIVEGNTLNIFAVGKTACEALNSGMSRNFSIMLNDNFGIDYKVVFVNDEEECALAEQSLISCDFEEKDVEEKVEITEQKKDNEDKRNIRTEEKAITLAGRRIKSGAKPIASMSESDASTILAGEVFDIQSRSIKNNKVIASILFSDGNTSTASKFFFKEDKWDYVSENLKPGDYVKIRGKVEWDSFANDIVLMGKDLEKTKRPERCDNAAEKRIELHAHTKMSAMDGLNDTEEMVNRAIKWGQSALAITDHGVVQSFPAAYAAAGDDIKIILGMEGYVFDDSDCIKKDGSIDYKKKNTNHIILIAKNNVGLMNLYKLVSISHIDYFYKRPRLPKSVISKYREGLIIGSACEAGEVFRAVLNGEDEEKIEQIADFYDYLEIQPLVNNGFMVRNGIVKDDEDLRNLNRKIISLGEKIGKPVVATTDAHYGEPQDAIYRKIIMHGQGYSDEGGQGLYMRTTEEMLEEFAYLGEDVAKRIVIDAPNKIASQIEKVKPVPEGKYPPKIKNAEKRLKDTCEERAAEIYGDPLPDIIRQRLDKELDSIIGNGYAVMYVSAQMLVEKSLSDGFLVGSRGSVGSSFAATMAGITEVNPLPPHYICPKCKHLEWGDSEEFDCGVDMPEMKCPECGTVMRQDGFSIPFETFLGFEGDKEPDIDLNFAGEYQSKAQKYVEEIFGPENVFKAGTIGTIKEKTAFGFVMKYFEEKGQPVNKYEIERLKLKCTDVKRTTGQHPGGVIIVPEDHEIYEFCPVQHPANDQSTDIITTHFDYHSIDKNLLKLDILGHDIPSMIRHLQDMTGVDPLSVPLKDEKVNSIFIGTDGLDIKDTDYRFSHGSYGIPEFGTRFVRQMLDDTKPERFADLVRISGFSHGTNVWVNNARDFIKSGQATMKDAISTRDDIMNYLRSKGVPNKEAFNIMEKVRKGKGLTDERAKLMKENGVPDWYIESCRRISYMFPRAHAVAYVMMSYRIAYYKVYYPAEFYAVYLTAKIDDFNWEVIKRGKEAVLNRLDSLEIKGKNATTKEQDEITVLEIVYEMFARGYSFLPPKLEYSKAVNFTVKDGKVVVPLCGLNGVGETAGRLIESEYSKRHFCTIEELVSRAKVNKTAIESMRSNGVLEGMPESDQISFF